ncbi:MAG: hypothetical protein WD403_01810 [Pirellulales bacterium]
MARLLVRHAAKVFWAAGLLFMPTAAWGVEYGWQPVAGGGIEYIIQIEPEMLDALKEGEDIFSDLPPATANIRGYRITVGTGKLPHQGEPLPVETPEETDARPSAAAPFGSPLPAGFDQPLPGPDFDPVESGQAGPPREFLPATARGASRLVAIPSGPRLGDPASAQTDEPTEDDLDSSESETDPAARSTSRSDSDDDRGGADAAGSGGTGRQSAREKRLAPANSAQDRKAASAAGNRDERSASDEPGASGGEETEDAAGNLAGQKPWLPLSLTLLGLFASLGANVYLVWIAAGLRRRYRNVVRQSQTGIRQQEQAADEPADPWEPDWERIYSQGQSEQGTP